MLVGLLGLCLLVGLSDSVVTRSGRPGWYEAHLHPPGTPPDWAFPVVWSALYVLMAVSAWLVWRHAGYARRAHYRALRLWGWQLFANALWTPAFFGLHLPLLALAVIAALFVLVGLTIKAFWRVDRVAAAMLVPYLAWVGYASWLTAGFWWLNRG